MSLDAFDGVADYLQHTGNPQCYDLVSIVLRNAPGMGEVGSGRIWWIISEAARTLHVRGFSDQSVYGALRTLIKHGKVTRRPNPAHPRQFLFKWVSAE
jgi:hypothetical protein